MTTTSQPPIRVRLIGDPGRIGYLTGREKQQAVGTYLQVTFPDRTEWIPKDQVERVLEGGEPPLDLLRRGRLAGPADLERTLTHIRLSGRLANFVYSLETTDTEFYAYQFKPVVKLLQSSSTGILVADEVGLGKTIEAGLIWTELRTRFDFQRLLVVCPAMLRDKWVRELRQRFGVRAEVVKAAGLLQTLRDVSSGSRNDFAIVTSFQSVRPPSGWREEAAKGGARTELAQLLDSRKEEEPLIDLLVMDEAHYLRNPETSTADLGGLLRGTSQYAVLLSATPVHLKSDDLFYLLRIVDEDMFSSREVFDLVRQANERLITTRDAVLISTTDLAVVRQNIEFALKHPLLGKNRQLLALSAELAKVPDLNQPRLRVDIAARLESANLFGFAVSRTRRREVKEWRAVREPLTLKISMNSLELEFYQTVTQIIRDFCERSDRHEGFFLVTPQRQMASSMAAACWYWSQDDSDLTKEVLEELGIDLPDAEPATVGPMITELRAKTAELGNLRDLTAHDTKYERLREELRQFLSEQSEEKVVLFSSFRHTLRYLRERLMKDGFTCALLLGGTKDAEEVLDRFRDSEGPSILLSSEVGSEGIDLQFAWVLVNYDLPWNPMRVEQRIGRLDRLGQLSQKVVVWNLVHEGTIDERIYDRLFMRLGIFERTVGGLESVLGPRINELTRTLLSQRLGPGQERDAIDQTRTALENIRRTEEALEKESAGLIAYGDYIVRQVQAARSLSRKITAQDIQRYTVDFLSHHYPGSSFRQDSSQPELMDIQLSAKAKNDLSSFLRGRGMGSSLTRSDPAPVRCRFENRLQVSRAAGEELITQLHPLVRFVAGAVEQGQSLVYPAVAARLSVADAPEGVGKGDYRLAVMRWTFEAIRTSEQLWFGVSPVISTMTVLDDDQAELFVTAVTEHGTDWPNASAELELARCVEEIESDLIARGWNSFDKYTKQVQAHNEDLAEARLSGMDTHLDQQRSKYEVLRRQHLDRSNPGLAKVQEMKIKKLESRIERERLQIDGRRKVRQSLDEICVGVVRVE